MNKLINLIIIFTIFPVHAANAYVGPGLALGAIIIVIILISVLIIWIIAFFYISFKRIKKKIKKE